MHLHCIDGSPFARILRVLVREHGVKCEEVEIVEFPPPDTLFDLNPLGQVPVLVDQSIKYFSHKNCNRCTAVSRLGELRDHGPISGSD